MSACIIPAGPEFQDPLGVQNSPPTVVTVSPAEGSSSVDRNPQFVVRASDLNLGDTLWIKWITEYPPLFALPVMTIDHSNESSPVRDDATFSPNCYQVNRLLSTHQITAAISDREFVPAGDLLETIDGTRPIQVNWTWQQTCPGGGQ
jgi:hypothetical protein